MITAGVDLAAMPERTALASIEWARTRAVVRDLVCPADDDVILGAIAQAGKTGIDCPSAGPAPSSISLPRTAPAMSRSPATTPGRDGGGN